LAIETSVLFLLVPVDFAQNYSDFSHPTMGSQRENNPGAIFLNFANNPG
jgi:hypothetical protein